MRADPGCAALRVRRNPTQLLSTPLGPSSCPSCHLRDLVSALDMRSDSNHQAGTSEKNKEYHVTSAIWSGRQETSSVDTCDQAPLWWPDRGIIPA